MAYNHWQTIFTINTFNLKKINMEQIIKIILENKTAIITIGVSLYELLIRVIPTAKSWSIITLISYLIKDNIKK